MKKVLITMTIAACVLAMSSTAFANADEMHKHKKVVHHYKHTTHVVTYKKEEMPMDMCPEEVARMTPMEHVTIVKHTMRPMRRHHVVHHVVHHHMSKMSKKAMAPKTDDTAAPTGK